MHLADFWVAEPAKSPISVQFELDRLQQVYRMLESAVVKLLDTEVTV